MTELTEFENADVAREEQCNRPGLIATHSGYTRSGVKITRGISRVRSDSSFAVEHPDWFSPLESTRGKDALRSVTGNTADGSRLANAAGRTPSWQLR